MGGVGGGQCAVPGRSDSLDEKEQVTPGLSVKGHEHKMGTWIHSVWFGDSDLYLLPRYQRGITKIERSMFIFFACGQAVTQSL